MVQVDVGEHDPGEVGRAEARVGEGVANGLGRGAGARVDQRRTVACDEVDTRHPLHSSQERVDHGDPGGDLVHPLIVA